MSYKCASEKKNCRTAVEFNGYWCAECQSNLISSRQFGDAVMLARIPNLDSTYQPRLASHPQALVRMILINERNDLTEPVRAVLLHDYDESVLEMAAGALSETRNHDLFNLIYRDEPELLFHLASNKNLAPRGLQMLCGHPDPVIAQKAEYTLQEIASSISGRI